MLKALLLYFNVVFGFKVNKSKLVPVGLVNSTKDLANILGCKVFSLPLKYLGLSIGTPHKSKSIWDGVIEKVENS